MRTLRSLVESAHDRYDAAVMFGGHKPFGYSRKEYTREVVTERIESLNRRDSEDCRAFVESEDRS